MRTSAAFAALLLASCGAPGPAPAISIDRAWARATTSAQPSTAAYFTIANGGGRDRLVGISSPTGDASLHVTSMESGIMRMRAVEALDIPAGSTVELRPGATHVMITGLRQELVAGGQVPLLLSFERSGELRVAAGVRAAGNGATL